MKETTFHINGQKIAACLWNAENGIPTIALHGWLDNAASFEKLAPLLPQLHIVAIDLPGHGHSSHLPPNAFIHVIDFVINTIQIANHLGWERFTILGHSLGAAIGTLVAGTIPDRIQQLLLIDGLGPLTTAAENAPYQLGLFIQDLATKPNKTAPRYPHQTDALNARLKANIMHEESVKSLLRRGIKQLEDNQWTWRTDPRLLMPSPLHLTEEQVLAFISAITARVCIVRPEPGYPFPMDIVNRRVNTLKNVEVFKLPGHHHVHLDDPEAVAKCLQAFLGSLE